MYRSLRTIRYAYWSSDRCDIDYRQIFRMDLPYHHPPASTPCVYYTEDRKKIDMLCVTLGSDTEYEQGNKANRRRDLIDEPCDLFSGKAIRFCIYYHVAQGGSLFVKVRGQENARPVQESRQV